MTHQRSAASRRSTRLRTTEFQHPRVLHYGPHPLTLGRRPSVHRIVVLSESEGLQCPPLGFRYVLT